MFCWTDQKSKGIWTLSDLTNKFFTDLNMPAS
jgi:hypothetical protein